MSETTTIAIDIGAYPMKSCPFHAYLSHAEFSRDAPIDEVDLMTSRRGERGREFEATVFIALKETFGDDCVVIALTAQESGLPWDEQQRIRRERTTQAMDEGAAVICCGALRDRTAVEGTLFRTGDPDVLVRQTSDADGATSYIPVEVKNHKTVETKKRQFARRSPIGNMLVDPRTAGFAHQLGWIPGYRTKDGLQLAHYTRVLEALGRHPGEGRRWGGVIGADPSPQGLQVTWVDLDEVNRGASVLGTYDAAFEIRVEAIRQAQAGTRYPAASAEGVLAGRFGKAECGGCGRRTVCKEDAGPDDASFKLTVGRPNRGGWEYLYAHGAGSINSLAALSVADHEAGYDAASAQRGSKPPPLMEVVERARMHRDGELLRLVTPTATVPTFDVEIDFDIEWDEDQLVYLWGAIVRREQDPSTETFEHARYEFAEQTHADAEALAARFFANLDTVIDDANAAGKTIGLFHWTPPEQWQTGKFLGETLSDRYGAELVHDLQIWVKNTYFSRDGFSLKKIAPACGFAWTVDEAGGDMSMVMVDQFRTSPDPAEREAAKAWLLSYNEADCRAQSAIRDHLGALPHVVSAPVTA